MSKYYVGIAKASLLMPNMRLQTESSSRGFFPLRNTVQAIDRLGLTFGLLKNVKNYLENVNFDYLHCHDLDGIIAGWLMFRKDARLIFDMHEFYEVNGRRRQKLKYLVRALVGFFQSKSDYIIHVNNSGSSNRKTKPEQARFLT